MMPRESNRNLHPLERYPDAMKNLRNMKDLMYRAGFRSFATLGDAVNLNANYLWHISHGDMLPTVETYNKIAQKLGWQKIAM